MKHELGTWRESALAVDSQAQVRWFLIGLLYGFDSCAFSRVVGGLLVCWETV